MSDLTFVSEWLKPKLRSLDFDEDVFGNYIMGILTSDETSDEKRESLEDILSGATASEISGLCDEICEKWAQTQEKCLLEREKIIEDEKVNLDEKLAFIMEKQAQSVKKVSSSSETEKKLKEAILAQYAQISDEDDDNNQDPFENSSNVALNTAVTSIPLNTNVHSVINAEKELREKAKAEYEKKKAQDKLNREKQKQKQQERREKERKRTQKGEHRR